jgi:hypothetical protein
VLLRAAILREVTMELTLEARDPSIELPDLAG